MLKLVSSVHLALAPSVRSALEEATTGDGLVDIEHEPRMCGDARMADGSPASTEVTLAGSVIGSDPVPRFQAECNRRWHRDGDRERHAQGSFYAATSGAQDPFLRDQALHTNVSFPRHCRSDYV